MKFYNSVLSSLITIIILTATPITDVRGADANSSLPPQSKTAWPRHKVVDGKTMVMYQPQIESWNNNNLQARAVIAVSPQDSNQTIYGVVFFSGQTDIDKEQRVVNFKDIKITKVTCPAAPDKEPVIKSVLDKLVPQSYSTSLDHVEVSLAMTQAQTKAKAVPVKNDPPIVYYSTTPAVLVLVQGEPVLKPYPSADLKRVINTQPLLLYDAPQNSYYLRFSNQMDRNKKNSAGT